MKNVPHANDFEHVCDLLGRKRADAARAKLNQIRDELPPASGTGLRVFSSSYLGSSLSPWTGRLEEISTTLLVRISGTELRTKTSKRMVGTQNIRSAIALNGQRQFSPVSQNGIGKARPIAQLIKI